MELANRKQNRVLLSLLIGEEVQEVIYSLSNAGEGFESKIKSRQFFYDEEKIQLGVLCFSKCSAIPIGIMSGVC